jgi:hypothetical protein
MVHSFQSLGSSAEQDSPFLGCDDPFPPGDDRLPLASAERRAGFEAAGQHFESRFHLTLTWLPPADSSDAAARSLVERPDGTRPHTLNAWCVPGERSRLYPRPLGREIDHAREKAS